MEFQELMNRVARRLNYPYSKWTIRGNTYWFRDTPGSIAPVIVYNEIKRGFYNIPLKKGDVVLDLGAHIGMFTIPLAHENPGVQFICYEPNPANFKNLCKNVEYAGLTNVICINKGLARQDDSRLYSSNIRWNSGGSPTLEMPKIGFSQELLVDGVSLETMRKLHNPTVLKIDVEGAEFGAIFRDNLKGLDYLVMEIHGHLGPAETMLDIVQTSVIDDYRVMVIDDPKGKNGVYIKNSQIIYGVKEDLNCLK